VRSQLSSCVFSLIVLSDDVSLDALLLLALITLPEEHWDQMLHADLRQVAFVLSGKTKKGALVPKTGMAPGKIAYRKYSRERLERFFKPDVTEVPIGAVRVVRDPVAAIQAATNAVMAAEAAAARAKKVAKALAKTHLLGRGPKKEAVDAEPAPKQLKKKAKVEFIADVPPLEVAVGFFVAVQPPAIAQSSSQPEQILDGKHARLHLDYTQSLVVLFNHFVVSRSTTGRGCRRSDFSLLGELVKYDWIISLLDTLQDRVEVVQGRSAEPKDADIFLRLPGGAKLTWHAHRYLRSAFVYELHDLGKFDAKPYRCAIVIPRFTPARCPSLLFSSLLFSSLLFSSPLFSSLLFSSLLFSSLL
jgi:hypothetical protein